MTDRDKIAWRKHEILRAEINRRWLHMDIKQLSITALGRWQRNDPDAIRPRELPELIGLLVYRSAQDRPPIGGWYRRG